MGSPVQAQVARYAVALAAVALATGARLLIDPLVGDRIPFITYFVAVAVTAWYGGLGPSLLTVALSALAAAWFFLPLEGAAIPTPPRGWLGLAFFVAASGVVVWASHHLHFARERAERNAEQFLRERERFYVTLASIGDGVIVTDERGRVSFLNAVAEELTGWTQSEAEGRPLDDVFRITNEHTHAPVENPAIRALREGRVVGLANHTVLTAKDGAPRAIDDSAAPILTREGSICGVVLVFRDVTERRRSESLLRTGEALKTAIVETAMDCLVVMDHEGRVLEFNAAAEKTFGYARQDVLGRPMAELLIPPRYRQRHRDGLARYLATGESTILGAHVELAALRADGEEFPVEISITRISAEGPPVFAAYLRDITQRKRAERRRNARWAVTQILNESLSVREAVPRVLEAICQSLEWDTGAIWTLDAQAHVLRCRELWRRADSAIDPFEQASRQSAFPLGEGLPGRIWANGQPAWIADVVCDANFPRAPAAEHAGLHAALGSPVTVDGDFFGVIEFFSRQIQEPDDDLLELVATIGGQLGQFIERRRAEEARRESERLYRAIGESIDYGVWVCDPDGRNIYASESFLRLVGLTQEQCSNFGWGDVLHPDDAQRTLVAWQECVRTMGVWDIEHRFRGTDGQYHPVLARGVPVKDEEGRVACWVGINLDISRLKQVERELQEANRRKDEFLAMLGHELRNPLAPIRSGLDVLALETGGHNETIALMQEQVEHLVRLVDDLLDVSRIIGGKIELRKEPVDLRAIIKRAAAAVRPLVESQRQELIVAAPDEAVWLDADPVRLVQVTENLLNNASKYSDEGARIELSARRENGQAVVSVRDNGIGIEPELLPRVFDWFTQSSHSYHRSRGGLGLGLTLVRSLVEMHGGAVAAHSEGPGRGSEFVVRLPIIAAPNAATQPSKKIAALSAEETSRRILIVDDNVGAARTLALLLGRLGPHAVEVAHDGPTALTKAAQFHPDLVLLDIAMPGMNGYEVARALRQTPADAEALLVAVTGYGQEDDRRRSREAGFDEHLVKPPSQDALVRLLNHSKLNSRPQSPADSALPLSPSLAVSGQPPRSHETAAPPIPPLERRTGAFLRELTHEVGNAVQPFQLMLQVLQQPGLSPAMLQRMHAALEAQLPSLERLLRDLRRVSQIARGVVEPQPRAIDPAALVRHVAEAFRPAAEKRGVCLEIEAPETLPPMQADPSLLEQALTELLQNAMRHTGRGGRIFVNVDRQADRLCLHVRDTGAGISQELLPHVFDLFVRGDSAETGWGRLGVGLALVRQIAEKHGGRVEAHSAGPGQGSEFTLHLPFNP